MQHVTFTRVAVELYAVHFASGTGIWSLNTGVHEVAKLTLRYQAGQSKGAEKLPDQGGLPDEYMDALIQSLDIQCK